MIIQATALPRVMICEGSAIAADGEQSPVATGNNQSAMEGTAAHELASAVLLGLITDPSEWIGKAVANGIFITDEMADHVRKYTDVLHGRTPTRYHVEVQTDHSFLIVGDTINIRGRADWIDWDETTATLRVDDFKYGYRLVEPDENWTLISHAIAYCLLYGLRPSRIVFTVHQPRPFHRDGPVREWEFSGDQLDEFRNTLYAFFERRGSAFTTSDHCRDCPIYANCPSAREASMNAVDVSRTIAVSEDIPNDVLSVYLDDVERAKDTLELMSKALTEIAIHRAQTGQYIPNYHVEMAYGHRAFGKDVTPGLLATMSGVALDKLQQTKTVTPAQAQRAGVSETIVNTFSKRPTIGLKLIREDVSKLASKLFAAKP